MPISVGLELNRQKSQVIGIRFLLFKGFMTTGRFQGFAKAVLDTHLEALVFHVVAVEHLDCDGYTAQGLRRR